MLGGERQKTKGAVFFYCYRVVSPFFRKAPPAFLFWIGDRFPFSLSFYFTKDFFFISVGVVVLWRARGVVCLLGENTSSKNQMLSGPFAPSPFFFPVLVRRRARKSQKKKKNKTCAYDAHVRSNGRARVNKAALGAMSRYARLRRLRRHHKRTNGTLCFLFGCDP